jgi:putative phosphotransacetylase
MQQIIVETSARHIHITQQHFETLFGAGAAPIAKKTLGQPDEFVCEQRVSLEGPKGRIERVCILGPVRWVTQVEISATDARTLGIKAPVRESGDIKKSGSCRLVGPVGVVELEEGVIIAKRHIHLSRLDSRDFGLADGELVQVRIDSPERSLVFDDVVCRVGANAATRMHIDTDEANAAGLDANAYGTVFKRC